MYDVICIGGATVDIFLDTNVHEHNFDRKAEICYPLGSKIKVNNVKTFTGGGGTNCAVAFSRLGLKTGFIGKIGRDGNGEMIYDELEREKVDFLGVMGKEKTDFSIVLDAKGRDRTILNYKEASSNLKHTEIKDYYSSKWFYFTSVLGETFETMKRLAKNKGRIEIGFNSSTYMAELGFNKLKDILNNTSVFVLNKEEAEILTRKKKLEDMFKEIRKHGPRIIAITDGKNGASVFDGNFIYTHKPHNLRVVETTGAGDAYAATLIAGIIKGKKIEDAMKMAILNSESVVMHAGAKNILLSYNEIMRRQATKVERREAK